MHFRILFFITTFLFSILLTSCSGEATSNSGTNTANTVNSNAANSPANTAQPNSNSPLGTTAKPAQETTNNAPTLRPVVDAYYDAIRKKDDAGMRKVLAADFIKSIEVDMKEEKKTNLAAYIAETEKVPETIEVRNEKIVGDNGSAELKGGTYATWTPFGFVKEGGSWKFSGKDPVVK